MFEKNINVKEYITLIGSLLLAYILCLLLPSFGFVFMLFMAAIVCIIGISFGLGSSLLSSAILFVFNLGLTFLFQAKADFAVSSVIFLAIFSGIMAAYCFRKKFPLEKTTILTAIAVAVGIMLPIFLVNQFFIQHYISDFKSEFWKYIYQVFNQLGNSFKVDKAATEQIKNLYIDSIKKIMPAVMIIGCAFFAFVFPFITRWYLKRRGRTDCEYMIPFSLFKADKVSAVVLIITFLLASISSSQIKIVFQNLLLICSAGMGICGLAVTTFYLNKWVKSKFMRALLYVLILFIPLNLFLLISLGTIDAFVDFRHLKDRGDSLE